MGCFIMAVGKKWSRESLITKVATLKTDPASTCSLALALQAGKAETAEEVYSSKRVSIIIRADCR